MILTTHLTIHFVISLLYDLIYGIYTADLQMLYVCTI